MRRAPLEKGRDGLVQGHSSFYFSAKCDVHGSGSWGYSVGRVPMIRFRHQLILPICLLFGAANIACAQTQDRSAIQRDTLTPSDRKAVSAVEDAVAKQLRILQTQAHARVMGRLSASERNVRLVCTLAHTLRLNEKEGGDVGVVSFVSADPGSDPALEQLVKFPSYRLEGEYGFHYFDVAAWPLRDDRGEKRFAVRIEMRQGLYWDWADSHITDDSLGKDWWRPLVVQACE